MRKNNRLISIVLPVLLLISWHGVAQAMGKRPEQGKAKAVSRLTPEQERQAKAEFDSLMAKYDPWEAVKGDRSQHDKLKRSGLNEHDVFLALEDIIKRYPHSTVGDQVLHRILVMHLRSIPAKDTSIGTSPSVPNPVYRQHYNESLRYALQLSDQYPTSTYAEKSLLLVGSKYVGELDEPDGKYIKPYIEFVNRYKESKYISFVLFLIARIAEHETGEIDYDTSFWAYHLLRSKYDNQLFYYNLFDDPGIEKMYSDQMFYTQRIKENRDEKENLGMILLNNIAPSIGHAMISFYNKNGSFPNLKTKDSNYIYKFLQPYCWKEDIFNKYNPFMRFNGLKLNHFESNSEKYIFELQLFDIVKNYSSDMSEVIEKREK